MPRFEYGHFQITCCAKLKMLIVMDWASARFTLPPLDRAYEWRGWLRVPCGPAQGSRGESGSTTDAAKKHCWLGFVSAPWGRRYGRTRPWVAPVSHARERSKDGRATRLGATRAVGYRDDGDAFVY